jgi:BirA family biotin operon repressor/biotin-[acetyl-CoA-carboxylase] ligase
METLFIGRNRIELDKIDSTNNYAANVLQNQRLPEGTVIRANFQTGGRGQRGHIWESEPNMNLLCSIVLYPVFLDIRAQFLLNKTIALAVFNTVKEILPSSFISIKWPNDILLNERKLSGILIENTIAGSQIVSSLAGVGINLNQTVFNDAKANAISLKQVLNQTINAEEILAILCKQLEVLYLQLKFGNHLKLEQDYQDALWKKDELVDFRVEERLFPALVKRVDQQGRLVVKAISDQVEYSFYHGEIGWK